MSKYSAWVNNIDPWVRTWLEVAKDRSEAEETFRPCRTKEELEGAYAEAEGYARRASAVIRAAEAAGAKELTEAVAGEAAEARAESEKKGP